MAGIRRREYQASNVKFIFALTRSERAELRRSAKAEKVNMSEYVRQRVFAKSAPAANQNE